MSHITFENLKQSFKQSNDMNLLQTAIQAGFDLETRDQCSNTLLIWASYYGNNKAVRMLLEHQAYGNRTNPNVYDTFGGSPLLYASTQNLDSVSALVQAGADIHHKSNNGSTALMLASKHGNLEIVRFLLDMGANILETNNYGATASEVARMSNYFEIADLIESYTEVPVKSALDE